MTHRNVVKWARKPLRHLTATELDGLLDYLAGRGEPTDDPLVAAVRRELSNRRAIRPDEDDSWLFEVG
ncbi:MAG: hypothetical protein GEV11_06390 [Streptosporangiales bacterium]|nr:hypothetical protein [Streptosporangiales bacterium]